MVVDRDRVKSKALYILFFIFGLSGWAISFVKPNTYDQLSPSMTYNYVKSVVWYHSRGKVMEIESILLSRNLDDQEAIKRSVRNMLKHRTSVYLREFNTLDTPIESVGDIYEELFEFEAFLDDIYSVIFSESDLDIKLRHVLDVMEFYQTKANKELLMLMSKKEFKE